MSDILGVPAFGGGGISHRPPPDHLGPKVPEVTAIANDASATFNKGTDLPSQNGDSFDTSKSKRDDAGAYAPSDPHEKLFEKPHFDADTLTGPTPSFQASLLEVESDLRNVIAQVEAKRAQKSDAAAIAPAPSLDATRTNNDATPQDKAALSPTARRDLRETVPKTNEPPASNVAPKAPQVVVQTEAQDREAAYSGRAATADTPYSRPIAADLS
ncbi:MAG: hypothetical protein ACJAYH_000345 [Celeribacter sp.]|jgi:hypothetical protein